MGALLGLLSSKGGAAAGQNFVTGAAGGGSQGMAMGHGAPQLPGGVYPSAGGGGLLPGTGPGPLGPGGTGAGTGAGLGPLLPSTASPSMDELAQPSFPTLPTGPTTPYQAPAGPGAQSAMGGLLSHLSQVGQQQKEGGANKFMEMLQGFSPGVKAILGFMQQKKRKGVEGSLGTTM
jgi:hypothetical protein